MGLQAHVIGQGVVGVAEAEHVWKAKRARDINSYPSVRTHTQSALFQNVHAVRPPSTSMFVEGLGPTYHGPITIVAVTSGVSKLEATEPSVLDLALELRVPCDAVVSYGCSIQACHKGPRRRLA